MYIKTRKKMVILISSLLILILLGILTYRSMPIYIYDTVHARQYSLCVLNSQYELYENEIFFSDGKAHASDDIEDSKNLLVADYTSTLKTANSLDINKIEALGSNKNYLYCFRDKNKLTVIDMDTKSVAAEAELSLNQFEGFKKNGRVKFSLGGVSSDGAYVIIENGEQIWIVNYDFTCTIENIIKLNDIGGNVKDFSLVDTFAVLSLDNTNELYSGSFYLNLRTGDLKKISDKTSYNTPNEKPMIWNGYYLIPEYSKMYMVNIDGSGTKVFDMKYSSGAFALEGDYLYAGGRSDLRRYNLATGKAEISNAKKNYQGIMKIYDNKLFLSYIAVDSKEFSKVQIFFEPLDIHVWSPLY